MSKSISHAVATILFFDITKADERLFSNYFALSLLLANKLQQMKAITETKYETLVLIDKPTLSQLKKMTKWHLLTKAFDRVIVSADHEAYFLKIELWNIISDYSSIVYLDADCFIKSGKALDLLFEESLDIAEDIVACNESTWPDMFNTGVFAINNTTALSYKELVEHSKTFNELCNSKSQEVELYDNLDQGLLNYVFSNSWKNLSYVYNVQVWGESKSSSAYSDPSETYFLFEEKEISKAPEKTAPSETGYFEYANNALKQSKENKFLNKAMIVQFMDKPWESRVMDYVAPEYYSSFNKTKQDVCQQEEVEDAKMSETPPEKPKSEKSPAFEFPWIKYEDFPTANTREWR